MGKNSIGGAVLVNSKNPGDEWESKLRLAYDGFGAPGGMSSYVQYASGGPVSDNLKLEVLFILMIMMVGIKICSMMKIMVLLNQPCSEEHWCMIHQKH